MSVLTDTFRPSDQQLLLILVDNRSPFSPTQPVMQHPLVRLADTYRKIIIDRVARTDLPTQADRPADQSHGTDEGAEQTSGVEPTAGGDKG